MRNALMRLSLIGLMFGCLVSLQAQASDFLFGPEFNFSNPQLRNRSGSPVNNEYRIRIREFREKLALRCPECELTKWEHVVNSLTVKYPDGFYFKVGTDPSVIEINTQPLTTDQIAEYQDRIQSHIFDTALEAGLFPSSKVMGPDWAGNHIHVGVLSAFGSDERQAVKHLRNFFVDFANHRELALGVFSRDFKNAPPLSALPSRDQKSYRQIIAEVDSGEISSPLEFAVRIRRQVYDRVSKYQAFNVDKINTNRNLDEQTIELRAMAPQDSAEDYLLLTKLIEARIQYVKDLPPIPIRRNLFERVIFTEFQKANRFYQYVTETGLDFAPYERFMAKSQRFYLPAIKKIENYRKNRIQITPSCRAVFAH